MPRLSGAAQLQIIETRRTLWARHTELQKVSGMPKRESYEGMPLHEALVEFVLHHSSKRTRHITKDEERLLSDAAILIEAFAPEVRAFGQS